MTHQRTYVIDTNVLLHDPDALQKFPNSHLVVPVPVLEELDGLKKFRNELGANARAAIRFLDELKEKGRGDLHQGVRIDNGAFIRIQLEYKTERALGLSLAVNENKIIMSAVMLAEQGFDVCFVSKNFAARVKAEALGVNAEPYRYLQIAWDELYRGVRTASLTKSQIDHFFKDGALPIDQIGEKPGYANEYFQLACPEQSSALGRFNASKNVVERLIGGERDLWGIHPVNLEQRCAIDMLLRDDIPLVTLLGPAGTGKTLMALATALRKVFDEGTYSRLLVTRPIMPLGKDIGYLPGSKEEKLLHWMQPIYDNLEVLCGTSGKDPTDTLRWVLDSPKVEMEAVTYIRGRTLPKVFMIIDEAQNLTPHEVKTIISRAGKGTKVVLTGDPSQIDNPYLDRDSNGLSYTVSRFRNQPLFGHILLQKSERSALAALAAEIM